MKNQLSILILKNLKRGLWLSRRGSGTALPGLLAEKHNPGLFTYFAKQLKFVVLITGTNGKTTTKTLLSEILDAAGQKHITNEAGSNLKRGILSTFITKSNIFGKLKSDFAVFEVEEATLPKIVKDIKPNILIVTNLFRDQLDAYGEVNKTREYILSAIKQSPDTKLILNADDPMVAGLSNNLPNKAYYFSLPKEYQKNIKFEKGAKESTKPKKIDKTLMPETIKVTQNLTTEFELDKQKFNLQTLGFFHIYNGLAAVQAAQLLNIPTKTIQQGFDKFTPAFGRGEEIIAKGWGVRAKAKPLWKFKILLVKNPAGLSLTLEMLAHISNANILFILNDKIADGKDVSWIWDSKLEPLKEMRCANIFVAGSRANDMALRIKYAIGEKYIGHENCLTIDPNIRTIIGKVKKELPAGGTIYVLPTYTAMNEFRKVLGKKF